MSWSVAVNPGKDGQVVLSASQDGNAVGIALTPAQARNIAIRLLQAAGES